MLDLTVSVNLSGCVCAHNLVVTSRQVLNLHVNDILVCLPVWRPARKLSV